MRPVVKAERIKITQQKLSCKDIAFCGQLSQEAFIGEMWTLLL